MRSTVIGVLRVIIALSLAGSLVVQGLIAPALWIDLDGEALWGRVLLVSVVVLGVLALQVFAVCIWKLLTLVRRGSVFSASAFRYLDVIVGSFVTLAVLAFVLAVALAPGETAPGIVGLISGAALVWSGLALLVVVTKALLRQAIAREQEARSLRSELDEVI